MPISLSVNNYNVLQGMFARLAYGASRGGGAARAGLRARVEGLTALAANTYLEFANRWYAFRFPQPYFDRRIKPFLGTNFYGYQMDLIGFDSVLEWNAGKNKVVLSFIEMNDWRSSGASNILLELGGENILQKLAPVILNKAKGHFDRRMGLSEPG